MTGSSPMCSSMTSAASHSRATSTPVSRAEAVQRVDEGLAGDAVERQRERIDGGGDQVGAGLDGGERSGQAGAGGPWT